MPMLTPHTPRIFCRCGKPLKARVRRDSVVFECPDHGIVWRYIVNRPNNDKDKRRGSA